MASIEFPLSFTRQFTGPLDTTAVFETLADLNTYIASNPIAYAGQIVSVSSDGTLYIIMDDPDNPGTFALNTAVDQEELNLKADKSTVGDLADLVVGITQRDNLVIALNQVSLKTLGNEIDIGDLETLAATHSQDISDNADELTVVREDTNILSQNVNNLSGDITSIGNRVTNLETDINTKPSSADYDNIVQITQTAYNNLGVYPSTTLYIIVG